MTGWHWKQTRWNEFNLTDEEAFALEIELIASLRPLKNKLAGGNGCVTT